MTGLQASVTVPGRVRADLSAEAGEVVAVVGPNGAGKTSLLHALAGIQPAEGTVHVAGRDWTTLPIRERRVGLVFQDQGLFPHLDALGNVAFGPRARGRGRAEAEAIARDWLDRLGVGDLASSRPGQLSGGQAQRVALARALATEPELLLLDEPFSGLDVGVAAVLRVELARHLAEVSAVTLLVTHDAIDALTLADRVVVLDEGVVAQAGPPAEVAARPVTSHVARLVGLNLHRAGDRLAAYRPSDVLVSTSPPDGSARHRWTGRVAGLSPHGDVIRLLVETRPEGERVLADLTPAAVAELRLAPGREVWLSVKETALTWYPAA